MRQYADGEIDSATYAQKMMELMATGAIWLEKFSEVVAKTLGDFDKKLRYQRDFRSQAESARATPPKDEFSLSFEQVESDADLLSGLKTCRSIT